MSYGFNPGAALGLVAGLVTLGVGVAVLRMTPRRRDALGFGAFALAWGLFTGLVHVSLLAQDVATMRPWVYAYVGVAITLYLPLLVFVVSYPTSWTPWASNPVALAAAGLPALVGLLLYAAEPSFFVEDVVADPPPPHRPVFGALGTVVAVADTQLAFAGALGLLAYRLSGAEDGTHGVQLNLLVAGFLAYVSYRASDVLHAGFLIADSGGWPWQLVLRFAAAAVSLAAVAGALLVVHRREATSAPWRGLTAACGALPFLVGLLEVTAIQQGVAGFRTDGLWRLASAGLFAYALARTRLFDLDVPVRAAAAGTAYAVVPAGLVLALWTGLGSRFAQLPWLGFTASVGAVLVGVGGVRVASRWIRRTVPRDDQAYRSSRELAAYKTAFREAERLDHDPAQRATQLDQLRERLDLDPEEHRVLTDLARAEVADESARPSPTDRFEVREELGRGGFGRAYLAHDRVLQRDVVLKEPHRSWLADETTRERFLQEARLAAGVSHENVVTLYEVVDHEPPLLVFEHVPGGSLRDLLDREGPLDPDRAVQVACDVLAGLQALHEAGIVHRDVKPDNVLLDDDGQALLSDLGAAKPPDALAASVTLAADDRQVGSLGYMSPEQSRGDDAQHASDLYSVGALLYRCLTGEHYVDLANVPDAIARQRTQEQPPRLPHEDVPAELEAVIGRALAKAPEDRYRDAAAMLEALQATSPSAREPEAEGSVRQAR